MNKENLHSALILLMGKLEDIKGNPMVDKTFVVALTEVFRYFRDNGELKEALTTQQKKIMEDIEKSPFTKTLFKALCSNVKAGHTELPEFDVSESIKEITSEEFVEERIKKLLDE